MIIDKGARNKWFALVITLLLLSTLGLYLTYGQLSRTLGYEDENLLFYGEKHNLRIALVKPVFTATAYSSFYSFYSKYAHIKPGAVIKTDLNLLNATLVNGWGWSRSLYDFLHSNSPAFQRIASIGNISVISDVDVTQGALFDADGRSRYDVVIIGFEEYVTAREYFYFKSFVYNGGILIIMDATNFLAEVSYNPNNNHVALLLGHGWSFNGTAATPGVYDRWKDDARNWIASNYCCYNGGKYDGAYLYLPSIPSSADPIAAYLNRSFGPHVFTSYHGHEENKVTNMTATSIIAIWRGSVGGNGTLVASYVHHYGRGMVIHFGVMGSDIVAKDKSAQEFLFQSLNYADILENETD